MTRPFIAVVSITLAAASVQAASYDLKTSWSDAANPNGTWTYREGLNALPHVASWQSSVGGGWSSAQPGWARSENGSDRLPFFFKSNGSETFTHDFVAGDIIVHTTDPTNGAGQGLANYRWTSPDAGLVSISGGVWMGRDIGRAAHWSLIKNGTTLTEGDISSGDVYSRAMPFNLAAGTGGAAAVTNVPLTTGDQFTLTFNSNGSSGDFVGSNLTFTTALPEPSMIGLATLTGLTLRRRRAI